MFDSDGEGHRVELEFEATERFQLGEERCWTALMEGTEDFQWRKKKTWNWAEWSVCCAKVGKTCVVWTHFVGHFSKLYKRDSCVCHCIYCENHRLASAFDEAEGVVERRTLLRAQVDCGNCHGHVRDVYRH